MATPGSRQEFAALVNETRRAQHLSIRALARIADVPPTTAQGWLTGRHFPTPALRGNFQRVVNHLGLADAVPVDLWEDSWSGIEPTLHTGHSPYLGLRPFAVTDRELFFGRASQSRRIASAVRELAAAQGQGLLALVGPSGSGKSSVLAAGLLGQELSDGELVGWAGRAVTVEQLIATQPVQLDDLPTPRLVVIDHFEDALVLPPIARQRSLVELARLARSAVVVIGLRSDAFAAAAVEPILEAAMSRPLLLAPMTRGELRDVIVQPAVSLGVEVEENLVRVLLDELAPGAPDSRVAPGTLPLLSNALLVIWAFGGGQRLTLDDYHRVGGVATTIEHLAEQVYLSLDPAQQDATERLFLRLVRTTGDVVARETVPLTSIDAGTRPVLDAFVAVRMLTIVEDAVRISHLALLSHWQRLVGWLEDHRDDVAVLGKLRRAAEVWQEHGRDAAALIPVTRLALFTDWLADESRKGLLSDSEREFVAASEAHHHSSLEAERAAGRRLRRRGRIAIAAAAIGVVLALVSSTLYVRGRGYQVAAETARNEAQSRQLALAASGFREQDRNLQSQIAVVAADLADTTEATTALLDATSVAVPTRWLGGADALLAVSTDRQVVVRGDGSGRLTRWRSDELERSPGTSWTATGTPIIGLALAGVNGRTLLAVITADQRQLWDIDDDPRRLAVDFGGGGASAVAFGPDGQLVFGTESGGVELWGLAANTDTWKPSEQVMLPETAGPDGRRLRPAVTMVALDARRRLYAGGQSGRLARWRLGVGSPAPLAELVFPGYHRQIANSIAFAPDGDELALGLSAKAMLRWRLRGDEAEALPAVTGFADWIVGVDYSVDGAQVVAASLDQSTTVLDRGGDRLRVLPGPSALSGAAFVGDRLVTTSKDGTLRVWPADDPRWRFGGSELYNLSTDATASLWLAGGTPYDGIQLWRLQGDGGRTRMPVPATGLSTGVQTGAVAVAPSGDFLLGGTIDGRLIHWPLAAGGAGKADFLDLGIGYIAFVQASPDSKLAVAMGYQGKESSLLSLGADGEPRLAARLPVDDPQMLWFSADSRLLAIALPDRSVRLWDVSDPAQPAEVGAIRDLPSTPTSVAFAPSSQLLAIGTDLGAVSVWDVTRPEQPVLRRSFGDPHAATNAVLFSPDERTLVATGGDQVIRGWDLTAEPASALRFALTGALARPWDVRFLPGDRLAVSGGNGALQVWTLSREAASRSLCAVRGDPLVPDEWSRYLPGINLADPCAGVR